MKNRVVATPMAPKAVGPYSQAIIAGNTIYVSGQLPIDANTGKFVPGGIKEQLHQIFLNIKYILNEAGYDFENVAKTTVYLTDMNDFAALNEVYSTFFKEPFPARVAYAVAALPMGSMAEVDVIAVK